MGTLFVDKLDPQAGTAFEIGSSGDTMTEPSGATFNVAGTLQSGGAAVANSPVFAAKLSSTQSVAYASWTKILFATEVFDVGGDYDATNSKFVASAAGKYLFHYTCRMDVTASSAQGNWIQAGLYKNGSREEQSVLVSAVSVNDALTQDVGVSGVFILDLSASDYVEVYSRHVSDGGGAQNYDVLYQSFQGFKLI